jgi:hypothetical protein
LFDPVEEPFDLVASAIKVRAEQIGSVRLLFGGMLAHAPKGQVRFPKEEELGALIQIKHNLLVRYLFGQSLSPVKVRNQWAKPRFAER